MRVIRWRQCGKSTMGNRLAPTTGTTMDVTMTTAQSTITGLGGSIPVLTPIWTDVTTPKDRIRTTSWGMAFFGTAFMNIHLWSAWPWWLPRCRTGRITRMTCSVTKWRTYVIPIMAWWISVYGKASKGWMEGRNNGYLKCEHAIVRQWCFLSPTQKHLYPRRLKPGQKYLD